MAPSRITIPARCGKAIDLKQGQEIRVINTYGQQVVDTWAFNRADLSECMSMEHLRTTLGGIFVQIGDPLVTPGDGLLYASSRTPRRNSIIRY